MRFAPSAYMYEIGPGIYQVVHFPGGDFGNCMQPTYERFEFGTPEEARLYAAANGYDWGDPFAPCC